MPSSGEIPSEGIILIQSIYSGVCQCLPDVFQHAYSGVCQCIPACRVNAVRLQMDALDGDPYNDHYHLTRRALAAIQRSLRGRTHVLETFDSSSHRRSLRTSRDCIDGIESSQRTIVHTKAAAALHQRARSRSGGVRGEIT